ncbi:MAG: alpha/beta hydrolase family protein [Candidatus Coproplasma sp.]
MKKYVKAIRSAFVVALAALSAFAFSSCTESEVENQPDEPELSYTVEEVCSSRDGLNIYGKLYVPKDSEGRMPAVILSHSANLNADSVNSYAAGFAERGYIAYAFDFCGACTKSRSDGSTDDMTLFTEIEDLKAVLSAVRAMENVDAENVYLFGTSQGGLVTALTAEECTDTVRGEILLYPAFNIPELVSMASDWGGLTSIFSGLSGIFSGGYSQAFSDTLTDYDVYEHIGNFSKKVLIIHGSSDPIVKTTYSERAAELYADCTLKIIEGAGHGFNSDNYSMSGSYDDKVWEYIDEYLYRA